MALQQIKTIPFADVQAAVSELQGISTAFVAGAAAGTKMNVAPLRLGDTLLGVLVGTDAGGAWVNDVANCTIQDTHASGTLTMTTPANNDTFTVNGTQFTFKDAPTLNTHVKRTAADSNACAAAAASTINAYENRRLAGSSGHVSVPNTPQVVATVTTNVVTITSKADGVGNGVVISSSNGARLAVTGTTTASATVTAAAVLDADTLTLNGVVFTMKTTPGNLNPLPKYGQKQDPLQVQQTAVNNTMAANIANAINYYDTVTGLLDLVAVAAAAVVTITPRSAKKGNIIDISSGQGSIVASGAALAGGTATGGIKSSTALTSKSLFVVYIHKA